MSACGLAGHHHHVVLLRVLDGSNLLMSSGCLRRLLSGAIPSLFDILDLHFNGVICEVSRARECDHLDGLLRLLWLIEVLVVGLVPCFMVKSGLLHQQLGQQ